jgi:hypothetical protein
VRPQQRRLVGYVGQADRVEAALTQPALVVRGYQQDHGHVQEREELEACAARVGPVRAAAHMRIRKLAHAQAVPRPIASMRTKTVTSMPAASVKFFSGMLSSQAQTAVGDRHGAGRRAHGLGTCDPLQARVLNEPVPLPQQHVEQRRGQ